MFNLLMLLLILIYQENHQLIFIELVDLADMVVMLFLLVF